MDFKRRIPDAIHKLTCGVKSARLVSVNVKKSFVCCPG